MEMYQDGVPVYVLPENAICKADEYKRSPLDIEICPLGHEICAGYCDQYEEVMDDAWFCKNPDCKNPVLTSTMLGAHPNGCPKIYEWNRMAGEQNETD